MRDHTVVRAGCNNSIAKAELGGGGTLFAHLAVAPSPRSTFFRAALAVQSAAALSLAKGARAGEAEPAAAAPAARGAIGRATLQRIGPSFLQGRARPAGAAGDYERGSYLDRHDRDDSGDEESAL